MKGFFLCCCLLLCLSFWGCQSDSNTPPELSPSSPEPTTNQKPMNDQTQPPNTVITAVTEQIAQQTGLKTDALQIQETEVKTWSDGCLGLAKPDEFCTQALVEGWRIVVTDGQKTWVYRTDQTGRNLRQES
ncbi:hypothetical protein [Crocosphaera sp. XPORK-15E]|uniref:hypothetical protein n=1 Tax=Crocosphaera sp. XPORK-15E TaxID=3110247 RepID=UPI002B3749FD|nr:hypothetical protein [Crocosphaera sp. XPORK-15E]